MAVKVNVIVENEEMCYNMLMDKLQCNSKQLEVSPDLKREFAHLRKQMSENIKLFEDLEVPIVYLGKEKVPVTPYEKIKDQMPKPGDYFKYICTLIDSPVDIHNLINEPFMKWKADTPADTISDQLNEADVTMASGGADCDNLSWVAKRLFEALGCKNGFDYRARVIGAGGHAVCIYTEKDGKMYSIDQTAKVEPFTDIYDASGQFKKAKGKKNPIEVSLEHSGEVQTDIQLDPESLENNHNVLIIKFKFDYDKKGDFAKFFPEDWKSYKKCEVHFKDGAVVFYELGVFYEEDLVEGVAIIYTNSKNRKDYQKQYSKGEVSRECFKNGKLTERDFKDGKSELYDEEGQIDQINWPDGTIEAFKNGKLREKEFPEKNDIESEFYGPTGEMIQKNFRNEKMPHKTEWYENGKVIQYRTWEGKVVQVK